MVTQGSLLRGELLETGSPGPTPNIFLGAFIRHVLLHYTWQNEGGGMKHKPVHT